MNNLFQQPMSLVILGVLVVLIAMMFFNSRKRRQQQEQQATKYVPGAKVMTTAGIFATIVSVDAERKTAVLETLPGTRFEILQQAIARLEKEAPAGTVLGSASETEANTTTATPSPLTDDRGSHSATTNDAHTEPRIDDDRTK